MPKEHVKCQCVLDHIKWDLELLVSAIEEVLCDVWDIRGYFKQILEIWSLQ